MDKLGRTKMMAVDFSFATLNFYNNVKPSRKKMHVKTAVQLLLNTFLHVHKSLYFQFNLQFPSLDNSKLFVSVLEVLETTPIPLADTKSRISQYVKKNDFR